MQKFSKKGALVFGWKIVTNNFAFFLGLMALFSAFSFGISFTGDFFEREGFLLGSFIIFIVGVVGGAILEMGILLITLEFYDQKKPQYKDILIPKNYLFRYLIAKIAYGIVVIVGFILLIIPGIIWSIKYKFVRYLIVDKGMSVREAFAESSRITSGSKWNIFWLGFLILFINIVGVLALGVGLLLSVPVSVMAYTYVYRKLLEGHTSPGEATVAVPGIH